MKNPIAMTAALKLLPMLPALRVRHGDTVNDVAYSPDGRFLATASDDGTRAPDRSEHGR